MQQDRQASFAQRFKEAVESLGMIGMTMTQDNG